MMEFGRSRASFGSLIVDGRGTILGFDQAMEELTHWPAIEVVGHHKDLGLAVGSVGRGDPALRTMPLYEGDLPVQQPSGNLELSFNCRDGRRLDVETTIRPLEGPGDRLLVTVLRVLGSSSPAGPLREGERRDALTGLPDRDSFASRLAADLRAAAAAAHPLSLILLDVDHLRDTNDRRGHAVGDRVLKKIAGILRVTVGDESRIARLGGDDFAVLLAGGRGDARQFAATLRLTVERFRFFSLADELPPERITVSLGAASFPADADNPDELVERASEALEEARAMGRNRVWCYLRRPRVPLQVPVFFDGADLLLVGYTRDLSPSGIFVQTTAEIDVGMRCALAFPLPGLEGKVHVVGRVVRAVQPELSEDNHAVRVPGLGVEFERFGGSSDRRAIEVFLHEHESRTLRPETDRFTL
jgi:diguanylate cyclase (GGDEF)-like protein